jgi:hypothetical protein
LLLPKHMPLMLHLLFLILLYTYPIFKKNRISSAVYWRFFSCAWVRWARSYYYKDIGGLPIPLLSPEFLWWH